MKIPRSLMIGGRKIKVKFVDEVDPKDPQCLGLADYTNGLILIKKKMKRSAQEATFFHEAIHHMAVTLNHSLIDALAEQMYQMLKQARMLK